MNINKGSTDWLATYVQVKCMDINGKPSLQICRETVIGDIYVSKNTPQQLFQDERSNEGNLCAEREQ